MSNEKKYKDATFLNFKDKEYIIDLIFEDFGVSILPEDADKKKLINIYVTLKDNDGDDTFIQKEIENKLVPKITRKTKRKLTKAELRKENNLRLKRYVRVIVRDKSETTRIDRQEIGTDVHTVITSRWGNSNSGPMVTTKLPLGVPANIHYGAYLNLKNSIMLNIQVDKDTGDIVSQGDTLVAAERFEIKILPDLTKEQIEEGKRKQIIAEARG